MGHHNPPRRGDGNLEPPLAPSGFLRSLQTKAVITKNHRIHLALVETLV